MSQENGLEGNQIDEVQLPDINTNGGKIGFDDPEAQTTQTNNSTLVQGTQSDTGRPIPDQDITVIKPDRDISPTILESPTQSNSPNDKIDKLSIIVIPITAFVVTLICNYATIWRDTQKSIDAKIFEEYRIDRS